MATVPPLVQAVVEVERRGAVQTEDGRDRGEHVHGATAARRGALQLDVDDGHLFEWCSPTPDLYRAFERRGERSDAPDVLKRYTRQSVARMCVPGSCCAYLTHVCSVRVSHLKRVCQGLTTSRRRTASARDSSVGWTGLDTIWLPYAIGAIIIPCDRCCALRDRCAAPRWRAYACVSAPQAPSGRN